MSNKVKRIILLSLLPLWLIPLMVMWLVAVIMYILITAIAACGGLSAFAGITHLRITGVPTGLVLIGAALILIGLPVMLLRPTVFITRKLVSLTSWLFCCFKSGEVTE